ncbi:MAG TPA: ABC transporter permease [Chitinophagaceae bacterium]|nr:ABC transporter permease [Chitinophagaceae bacterium]
MLKNYIKTAWRNLLKNKLYSFLNLGGLTVGLSVGIIILTWVQNELSFDRFHKNVDNIYRLEIFGGTGASKQLWKQEVAPIGPLAKQQLPGVIEQARITENTYATLYQYGENVFTGEHAILADPSFFTMFDFPFIEGNPAKPFANNNSVVITEKTARKFFGNKDPLGKVIKTDLNVLLTVSGVIKDFPANSSMDYDMIMPMGFDESHKRGTFFDMTTNFTNYAYETYLLLKPGVLPGQLCKQILSIHLKYSPSNTDGEYVLWPLNKMHLYSPDGHDAGIQTVRIFIAVALLILTIACINYVNLSTARSMLRAGEISMRKIFGASARNLFLQFVIETTILFAAAAVLCLGIIFLLMPVFNQISGKELSFNLLDYHTWLILFATITFTLAASSIYPAMLLSSFKPLQVLRGKIAAGMGTALFRKVLVVLQFSLAIILIIGTFVIANQLSYIRSKELGYDKNNIIAFNMQKMARHYDAAKAELLKQPGILDITRSTKNIINNTDMVGNNDWEGKAPNQVAIVHPMVIDANFMSFFKMQLVRGQGFTGDSTDNTHFILNETAVKELDLKNPIGKRFRMGPVNGTIAGVVKDFHFTSMKEKIGPAVFLHDKHGGETMYIKTTPGDAQKAINAAEKFFKEYNGRFPFSYAFLDDTFNSLYTGEQREGEMFNYFAAIAILISCLGLFGLAAYTAQVRTREIGIRKVIGASVPRIIGLLAKDFIQLVLIAIIIAAPVAWLAMNKWLSDFAYRVAIGWTVFIMAGFIAILIAFITVSSQTIKVALTNPVKSLRTE